ncbi:MAG TPA: DUF6493 family protein [Chitinophaga sp.]
MTLQEQFDRILQKELTDELLPFLKALDKPTKKELLPHIRQQAKDYLEFREVEVKKGLRSFVQKVSAKQRKMLEVIVFVCCDRADQQRLFFAGHLLEREQLDRILDWYCPDWFDAYVNNFATITFTSLNYDWMISLQERGFLVPSPELIVRLIPRMIYENQPGTEYWKFDPQRLLKHDITLKEHIWYIFQFESNIAGSDMWLKAYAPEKTGWKEVLIQFANEGKIDRKRMVKEALLASNRNFDKFLSGWFASLFSEMNPEAEEVLELQAELRMLLHSPHGKPLSTALQCFKKLSGEEGFDRAAFLEHTPLLFSSTTKSVITATLSILEKVARQYKEHRNDICIAACQVFMQNNDDLQSRAARLVQKYGDPAAESLRDTLAQYQETMMVGARNILQDLAVPIAETQAAPSLVQHTPARALLDEQSVIAPVSNFDELLFLASQVFDNNEPYHTDQLLAALVVLQHEIRSANIRKLEPAFQRAYGLMSVGVTGAGELNALLAIFLIDFGMQLVRKYPEEAAGLRALNEKYVKLDEENRTNHRLRIRSIDQWIKGYKKDIFGWYLRFLQFVLNKITTGDTLPLLSTPTHAPAWISPFVLTDRLYEYQRSNKIPDELDMQIAISRIALEQTDAALTYAAEKLKDEYLRLMQFLLEPAAAPQGPFDHPSWWMIAAVTKTPKQVNKAFAVFPYLHISPSYLNGQCSWSIVVEHLSRKVYDYKQRKYIQEPYTEKTLRLIPDKSVKESSPLTYAQSFFSSLFSFRKGKSQPGAAPLIYEQLTVGDRYHAAASSDIRFLMLFTPNNPEPILMRLARRFLRYSTFAEEGGKNAVTHALQVLHELPGAWGDMGHLFIAACMVSSDKTVSAFSAEIWIRRVQYGAIQSRLIGERIGRLQYIAFVPLKRFNDLVMSHLFRLSDLHNAELEKLLLALLACLPDEPVKHLKKLLEIFTEVLSMNRSTVQDPQVIKLLKTWSASTGLNKITKSLVKE